MPWTIVRTVLVYGTGRELERSNFGRWVVDSLTRGEEIRVANDLWRTPTWVDDLARAIIKMTERGSTRLFHASGRECLPIDEFARRIARAFDLDESLIRSVPADELGHAAPRPRRGGLLIGRAPEELDFEPLPLDQALRVFRAEYEKDGAEAER